MNLVSTSKVRNYWGKFPFSLRLIIKARLWTAIGTGGVLYLNPIIFNSLGFSAEQIGSGITTAAFAGITTRFGTGYLLDKQYSYKKTIKIACLIAIISDLILFYTGNYLFYICGQLFLGAAAGIYWPSIELAVPLNCNNKIKSSEGYGLARSADAIGITLGVLAGTIGTFFEIKRIIYLIDITCMLYLFFILLNKIEVAKNKENLKPELNLKSRYRESSLNTNIRTFLNLIPLLILTLFVTGTMSLMQSILAIDLANGGILRPSLTEDKVATLITIKLVLLAIFQWPVGYILRNKNSYFKFRMCLISLFMGFSILAVSNLLINGYTLILIAFIPLTIAICSFLPSASDAIIKSSPINYRGSAIALYSQCFGFSALTIPLIAGKIIDKYDTAFQLWLVISTICLFLMPLCKKIK